MVKKQFTTEAAIMGTGAGVGLVQAYLTREVLDSMFGPIPYIGDMLGVWGTYSTLGNIAIGGVAFFVSGFTGAIKNQKIKVFLQGYGFTCLLGGLFNGIFPNLVLAQRLNAKRAGYRPNSMGGVPVSRPGMTNARQVTANRPMNRPTMPQATTSAGKTTLWA